MELNRELIKHVLECCKGDDLSLCRQCEYHIPGDPCCIVNMAANALALINKQETEYNELYELCESYRKELGEEKDNG